MNISDLFVIRITLGDIIGIVVISLIVLGFIGLYVIAAFDDWRTKRKKKRDAKRQANP